MVRVVARQLERRLRIEVADDARLARRCPRGCDCFTRYSALTSMLGLKSGVPKKVMRPDCTWNSRCTDAEIERVRAAVGAQRAAQREAYTSGSLAPPRPSDERRVSRSSRARVTLSEPPSLMFASRRAQPDLVAHVHRHAVEPEVLHELRRRLRHQRAVAHVGRVEQLGELLLREILQLLVDQLRDVDRAAVDVDRAAERAPRLPCRSSVSPDEPVETSSRARPPLSIARSARASRRRSNCGLCDVAEHDRSAERSVAAARRAGPAQPLDRRANRAADPRRAACRCR